ncbi:hypothetical protein RM812_17340 [Streptomyces sp. DSM 40712]|uniref:Uncharacterized protein n=2 Tax=Streptomyces lancefieldiae TaxID=3075520 RepID=A0ABU3AP82_9ACTN|nr:hypothetical protein [Streptomyces sp. DSM 40712]
MTTNNFEPPKDLSLSSKVKGLRKAYEDAVARLETYRQENARYAPRRTLNALDQYVYHVSAVQEAERDLREQEIEAAAAGKALPDRDKVLRAILTKVDEYKRMVPALEALVTKARKAFEDGVREELVPMGLREAAKAVKAREEWERLYKAAMEAKATLERHAGLFSWVVTAGDIDTVPRLGHSQGDNLEYWELNSDGMLTWEASLALEYQSETVGITSLVKVPGLIEPNPNPPVVEEYNHNPKPRHFLAKANGYGDDWEH